MEGSKFIDRPGVWHEQKLEAQERIMALQFGQVDKRLERIEALIEGLEGRLWMTVYGVIAVFQAVHRATRYAITRPARETLFSVIPVADKYKAKPMIDVFVYRFGDLAGMGFEGALRVLGAGLVGVAAATVPLAALWTMLSLYLGRQQQKMDTGAAVEEPKTGDAPSPDSAGMPLAVKSK